MKLFSFLFDDMYFLLHMYLTYRIYIATTQERQNNSKRYYKLKTFWQNLHSNKNLMLLILEKTVYLVFTRILPCWEAARKKLERIYV